MKFLHALELNFIFFRLLSVQFPKLSDNFISA